MAVDEKQYQTQRRGGTHRENFVKLNAEFHKILTEGKDISVRGLQQLMMQLLKSYENQRLECEKQIRKLKDELVFNQGTANACATFSNILVSMLSGYNDSGMLGGVDSEELRKEETKVKEQKEEQEEESEKKVVTDTEMLEKVCAHCGCQDEGDMKKCDCSCHRGKPCGNEECIVCKDLDNYKLKKKKRGRPKKNESIQE